MKIKIIFFVALYCVCNFAYGQEVTKVAFDKAIDYMNCRSMELSLKGSRTEGVLANFKSNCPCEKSPDYGKINSSIGTSESKTISLSSEINSIKEREFKPGINSTEVIKLLTNNVFNDELKYPKLYSFSNKRSNDTSFAAFRRNLKSEIASILSLLSSSNNKAADEQLSGVNSPTKNGENSEDIDPKINQNIEGKSWFDGFTFQIDVISILLTLTVLVILLKHIYFSSSGDGNGKISEIIKDYVKQKIYDAQFDAHSNLGSDSNSKSSELSKLKGEIEGLKSQIKKLGYQLEASKMPLEVIQPKYDHTSFNEAKQPEVKTYSEVLYLSTPNNDGSFNETSAQSSYREGASIYKFTKISSTKAEFQIDEREASVKLALQYPDKNIDPVCDAQNAFNPKAKKIMTLPGGVGEVDLVGDRWMLNRKAKIRYEN